MFPTVEHFNEYNAILNFIGSRRKLPGVPLICYSTCFLQREKDRFLQGDCTCGRCYNPLCAEVPVPVFTMEEHFPLKIPFPRRAITNSYNVFRTPFMRLYLFIFFLAGLLRGILGDESSCITTLVTR